MQFLQEIVGSVMFVSHKFAGLRGLDKDSGMTTLLSVKEIAFGPYVLEAENARLLRAGRPVALTPKALAVLHYLATRPDRLVTKNELLSFVWEDVLVSDASIKVCVREIRKALNDGAKTPIYIETVHRRGYRFIAPIR